VRFSPGLLDGQAQGGRVACAPLAALVAPSAARPQAGFDHEVSRWGLPPGLALLVGDVRGGGSSTPSMVAAINKFRREQPQRAGPLWKRIIDLNDATARAMAELAALASSERAEYEATLAALARGEAGGTGGGAAAPLAERLRDTMIELRTNMRALGDAAAVPLEPPAQTRLLDHTAALPGVLGGGVPGAGGFDAIFAVAVVRPTLRALAVWARARVDGSEPGSARPAAASDRRLRGGRRGAVRRWARRGQLGGTLTRARREGAWCLPCRLRLSARA
jgi:phosphomevalonate kinase